MPGSRGVDPLESLPRQLLATDLGPAETLGLGVAREPLGRGARLLVGRRVSLRGRVTPGRLTVGRLGRGVPAGCRGGRGSVAGVRRGLRRGIAWGRLRGGWRIAWVLRGRVAPGRGLLGLLGLLVRDAGEPGESSHRRTGRIALLCHVRLPFPFLVPVLVPL